MSQPTPYARQYSFSAFQVQNPTTTLPGQQVDIELNAVKATLDQILTNIALIQRDDGRVANNSVGLSQLDGALIGLGFGRPTTWLTATAYAINVAVFNGTSLYACLVAHTSGTFATDLAAGKWSLIVDFSTIVTPVQTYATNAAASAASATGSATAANSSAVAAAISQAAAAASATAAATTYTNIVSLTGGRSMFHSVTVGGSANAITVTHNPARVARAAGLTGVFTAVSANTITNPTFAYDGLSVATLTKLGGQPLAVGDIYGAGHEVEWVDTGTNIEIVNPRGVQLDQANTFLGVNAFNGSIGLPEQALVVNAGSAAWNMTANPNASLALTGATTLANATNKAIGQVGVLRITQDGTGGRILAFGTDYKVVTDCYNTLANAEYEYFYKVVAASGANSVELRAKTRAFVGPINIAFTSATTLDFSGANAPPTWVKCITLLFNGFSTSGTSPVQVQIGPSGTPETTGYNSWSERVSGAVLQSLTGFLFTDLVLAASNRSGQMDLTLLTGTTWIEKHLGMDLAVSGSVMDGVGSKTTASAINIVRVISVNTTDTSDAGSVTAYYAG